MKRTIFVPIWGWQPPHSNDSKVPPAWFEENLVVICYRPRNHTDDWSFFQRFLTFLHRLSHFKSSNQNMPLLRPVTSSTLLGCARAPEEWFTIRASPRIWAPDISLTAVCFNCKAQCKKLDSTPPKFGKIRPALSPIKFASPIWSPTIRRWCSTPVLHCTSFGPFSSNGKSLRFCMERDMATVPQFRQVRSCMLYHGNRVFGPPHRISSVWKCLEVWLQSYLPIVQVALWSEGSGRGDWSASAHHIHLSWPGRTVRKAPKEPKSNPVRTLRIC